MKEEGGFGVKDNALIHPTRSTQSLHLMVLSATAAGIQGVTFERRKNAEKINPIRPCGDDGQNR